MEDLKMAKHSKEVELINDLDLSENVPDEVPSNPVIPTAPVISDLVVHPQTPYVGEEVRFSYQVQLDGEATVVEEKWTNKETSYGSHGEVTVTLQIKDSHNLWSNELSVTFAVKKRPQTGGTQMENNQLLEQLYELKTCNALLISNTTGKEMYTCSLETHQVSQSVSEEDVKAGIDNELFLRLYKDRTITINLTDIQQKRDWFAAKVGSDLEKKMVRVSALPKNYTVASGDSDSLQITLDEKPVADAPRIYIKSTGAVVPAEKVSVSEKVLTIEHEGINAGDVVYVGSYLYETEAETLAITTDPKTDTYRLELYSPVMDASLTTKYIKRVVFHKCSLGQNWEFNGSTDITKQTTETVLTVMKSDDHDDLGFIAYEYPKK